MSGIGSNVPRQGRGGPKERRAHGLFSKLCVQPHSDGFSTERSVHQVGGGLSRAEEAFSWRIKNKCLLLATQT